MRSILIFFAVVLASFGLYWVMREEPAKPVVSGAGNGEIFPKPSTVRPQTDGGTKLKVQGGMGEITTHIPEGLVDKLPAKADMSWREGLSDVDYIKMEDAWDFDLSEVDYSKDVLCTVDGIEITKEDLQTWISLKHGVPLLFAKAFTAAGKLAAADTGIPYGLSDKEWGIFFDEFCEGRGQEKELVVATMAVQLKVPADWVEPLRRSMVENILAFFPAVESADELPLNIASLLAPGQETEDAARLGEVMKSQIKLLGRDVDSGGTYGAPLVALIDPLSFLFMKVGNDVRFRRTWTALDRDMPDGAVFGIYTGLLQEGAVLPPWEQGDQIEYVMLEEVWGMLEGMTNPTFMETELRDVIWSKVIKAKLAQEGALPPAGEVWREFASKYLAETGSLFNLDFVLQMRGYDSRIFFRNDLAITKGIENLQDEGWADEDALRAYFKKNGFFVLGWVPNLELALFPQHDPAEGVSALADWDRAKADADAFLADLATGKDFTTLRMNQNRHIVEGYQKGFDARVAAGFASEFGGGEFNGTMASTTKILRQTLYRDHINSASAIRNAVIRLSEGEVSPPWKTPIGYVVARVNSAHLGKLEEDFEDVIDLVENAFREWTVRKWVNDHLADAEFLLGL